MESNRGWLIVLFLLALAFLLLMSSVRGLRVEKITREDARWAEVHVIWDWNKLVEFWEEKNPFRPEEPARENRGLESL